MTVTFVNPVSDCAVAAHPYQLHADLSMPGTVALVINKIVDCDAFMKHVGVELTRLRPNLAVRKYETGKITFADASLMDQVSQQCDAAICAIGHCGSCTAGTVKDSIALAQRGIPVVSLITELFWDQSEMLAKSLGWPDVPRIKLPYPVWGTSKENMRAVARQSAESLILQFEGK